MIEKVKLTLINETAKLMNEYDRMVNETAKLMNKFDRMLKTL